jgi:HTH-type transcriptional regulator / antitoxin HipB
MLYLLPIGSRRERPLTIRSIADMASAIRGRRKDLGLSQGELADRIGVSRKWIYDFEAGKPTAQFGIVLRVLDDLGLVLEIHATRPPGDDTVDLDALLDELRS